MFWVNDDKGNDLVLIDVCIGKVGCCVVVVDLYNFYFIFDGKYVLVMVECLCCIDVCDFYMMKL